MTENFTEKQLGTILTPQLTAEYMCSKLVPIREGANILDPCVGPGVFIRILLENGVKRKQIHAYDIENSYIHSIRKLGIDFSVKDTLLDISKEEHNQFDFIIGNPPYLNKSSEYIRKHREELKEKYGHINAHETYSMFIVNAIWRLKEGGKLCFITSDSFLSLKTHERLRKFILNNCKINEILLAPKKLFLPQEVVTATAIITLTKCSGKQNQTARDEHRMRIVPRVKSEREYFQSEKNNYIFQKRYHILPFHIFHIGVEEGIVSFFENAPKLKDQIRGYIGMHTHDNRKFIAAIKGTDLERLFRNRNKKPKNRDKKYKIISQEEFENGKWKAYLKRGGSTQYYRPIMEALDWREESIPIYGMPKVAPFEEEGIVVSGVSSRLAARYMPKGCYWDSNKAIGFIPQNEEISIYYGLGILNSSLYNYLAKGIINNTSSIQLTGLHALPFLTPDSNFKYKVENIVREIIEKLKNDLDYDYRTEQRELDEIVFSYHADLYNLSQDLKKKLDKKYAIYS